MSDRERRQRNRPDADPARVADPGLRSGPVRRPEPVGGLDPVRVNDPVQRTEPTHRSEPPHRTEAVPRTETTPRTEAVPRTDASPRSEPPRSEPHGIPRIQPQTDFDAYRSDLTPMYIRQVGDTRVHSLEEQSYDPRRGLILRAVVLFWLGYVIVGITSRLWYRLSSLIIVLLVSLFFAFAIEPAVNKMAKRGWKRGRATALVMALVVLTAVAFITAIGALVATQISNLLQNTDLYITRAVDSINSLFGTSLDAREAIEELNRPGGAIDTFIENQSQSDRVIAVSTTALNSLVATGSVLLFGYYLVADGPRLRRAICSRLPPERQIQVLSTWELAINKTGNYLYSRLLLALISTVFHWVIFFFIGVPAPIPMALFVGFVSQFLPVVGTYLAGIVPVVVTFFDRDDAAWPAFAVLCAIVLYQQIENYVLAPRISAATMEIHPAIAFAAALAGISVLGVAGAVLAVPTAAMLQALFSQWGERHDVIDNTLTDMAPVPEHER